MSVTVEDLLEYVGSTDTDYAEDCLAEANALVLTFVGSSTVPEAIVDRAILETGSELFHRRNAPSGLQQFADYDGVPGRLTKDPMTSSYSLLRKYVLGL